LSLLPEDPQTRRTTLIQLVGFIGIPVICMLTMLAAILLFR